VTSYADLRHAFRDYRDTPFPDVFAGVLADATLAGPHGAHFHFWVPVGQDPDTLLPPAVAECLHERDAVGLTWDYVRPGPNWIKHHCNCCPKEGRTV
jgi:hypothetical protein